MRKVFILFFILISVISSSKALASDEGYLGLWECQAVSDGKPWGKKVIKKITHVNGKKYKVKVGDQRATNYIMDEFLRQDDNPKYGIMLKEGKLYSVSVKDGKPTVPDLHVLCVSKK